MNLFKKKETFEDLEQYQDTIELETIDEIMEKEIEEEKTQEVPQIIETYPVEYKDELEDYPMEEDFNDYPESTESTWDDYEEYVEKKKKERNLPRILMNIGFGFILLIGILVTIDVVMVSKFEKGPFFAIRTETYKDGGTKVYKGLGYKVIKYNQVIGRRDIEIGTWKLQYNANPIDINDLDFAIDYVKDPEKLAKAYHHKFIRLTSTVKEVNIENNTLTLEYFDEDGKYTLTFICEMAEKDKTLKSFDKGDQVSIIGTMREFEVNPNKIQISGCFAEEYMEISEE
ncbi:MAG: hypothetical protein IJ193_04885 [Bacilli bacterium]|nr:hypothetical protein [Bacilli bacterium]